MTWNCSKHPPHQAHHHEHHGSQQDKPGSDDPQEDPWFDDHHTPSEMSTMPGMISQAPENGLCLMPRHTEAMGHIAIGVVVGDDWLTAIGISPVNIGGIEYHPFQFFQS